VGAGPARPEEGAEAPLPDAANQDSAASGPREAAE